MRTRTEVPRRTFSVSRRWRQAAGRCGQMAKVQYRFEKVNPFIAKLAVEFVEKYCLSHKTDFVFSPGIETLSTEQIMPGNQRAVLPEVNHLLQTVFIILSFFFDSQTPAIIFQL